MVKYLALLSGFNEDLGFEEARAFGIENVERHGRILIFETDSVEKLRNAALTHMCCEFLGEGEQRQYEIASGIVLKGSAGGLNAGELKNFRVEVTKIPGGLRLSKKRIEGEIGGRINEANPGLHVELREPQALVEAIATESELYLGRLLFRCSRDFLFRNPRDKPFFHPSSMHPRIARVMANLANARDGKKVLDPFCGAGGILVEAGYLGARLYGVDISQKMVKGCKKNLKYYEFSDENIIQGNAAELDAVFKEEKFDAVVTDPPYGRGSSVFRQQRSLLYEKSLLAIRKVLAERGKLVISFPDEGFVPLAEKAGFVKKSCTVLPVHRSLTRYICVFEAAG